MQCFDWLRPRLPASSSEVFPDKWTASLSSHGASCCQCTSVPVLPLSRAGQVHGIYADRKIFMEPLGCLACFYSWAGEPRTLQAACLSVCLMLWPLLPSVASIVAPVPLCISHHHCPQQGVPTCSRAKGEQSRKTARTLHNIT